MSDTESQLTQRARLVWSIAVVGIAVALGALIYLQPQQLHAPAWVAYSAAAAFFVAGLLLLLGPAKATRTQNWLAVALLVCMVLPGLWVAFGQGGRQCNASFLFLQFESEALCRGAFGVGAILALGILALYVAHAIKHQRGA